MSSPGKFKPKPHTYIFLGSSCNCRIVQHTYLLKRKKPCLEGQSLPNIGEQSHEPFISFSLVLRWRIPSNMSVLLPLLYIYLSLLAASATKLMIAKLWKSHGLLTPLFFCWLFFLLVVSTSALDCLVLLMDGFTSLIFIYRFFFKDRKRRRRETQKIQSVWRMLIQMKVVGNKPLQIICWLFAFVFFLWVV